MLLWTVDLGGPYLRTSPSDSRVPADQSILASIAGWGNVNGSGAKVTHKCCEGQLARVVVTASCFMCCFGECARHGQGANIALVNAIGSMAATSGVYWSYLPPTLTSVSPTVVSPLGGVVVTIEGSNFGMAVPSNAVSIGGRTCSIVVRVLCRHLCLCMAYSRVTPHSVRAACSAQVPCCVCIARSHVSQHPLLCISHDVLRVRMCFCFAACVSV